MTLDKLLIGKTIKAIIPGRNTSRVQYEVTDLKIEYDGNSLIIEFTDGTKVEFWNSEWGGIKLIKDQESE